MHRRGRIERLRVADSPEAVSERLRFAFAHCFDRVITSCDQYGCMREVYHPRAILEGPTRRTLTIQMEVNAMGPARRAPPGGLYRLVVDVDPDPSGALVTFYGMRMQYYDRFLVAVGRWAQAIERPPQCPSLEGSFADITDSEIETQPASPPPPQGPP